MSNRNQSAAAGVGAADVLGQLREGVTSLKENLRTRNGKRFLFAVQFLLSLVNLFYFRGVIRMAYYSMFYRLDIPEENRGRYCFLVSLVCIFYGAIMIFTRRQIVTRLVILCSMPFYLPIFLFNTRYLSLVVPLAIMILITFLCSGTPEGPKTILGAVYLGLYIIGAFVFLTVQSILRPATTETVIKRDVTEGGNYRYSIVQELDQADGNTYVAIEPNTNDIEYKHSKWFAKGFTKEVYRERPLRPEFDAHWETRTRAEITRELIANNPNTTFVLNSEQMKILGRDAGYGETFKVGSLSMVQRHKLGLANEDDSIDRRIGKFLHKDLVPKDYEVELTFNEMVALGMDPTCEVRLSKMTDDELAKLGVPEVNEILIVNGKTVFRQYVAVLERLYWDSSRSLSAFLESNEVPEVHPEGVEIPEPETTETTTATTETTDSSETTETTAVTTTG